MSDTQHTPAPWIYGRSGEEGQFSIGLDQPKFGLLGPWGTRGNDYMLLGGICKESDARLMAISPKLLDEAKSSLEWLERIEDYITGDETEIEISKLWDAIKSLKSTIAEATGKESA